MPPLTFSWESGPMHHFPIPSPTNTANDLSDSHQHTIIRALNSIYIQAPSIPLSSSFHFTTYCLTIYRCLTAYDSPELARITGETQVTPELDAPLRAWGAWLESCAARRNNFSGVICRDFMDEFIPGLQWHFTALSGRMSGSGNVDAMMKAHMEKVFGGMSKTEELPAMLCNHDGTMGEFSEGLSGWERWMVKNLWAKKRKEV
ncbi:hypothetical protein SNOG_02039 [Parastagonospora nodorum SN15]|uniref:Uncharacterized protein n=1 Tax=Phaeosphaeria nodorum (strain SN15 / ATCC MYA-4574 / FGSC 10173) TaxID=321614 RepID=Q0V1S5_PHANO|nr:hypothetical protein SNOG_02039 [Parastagonospora nodorum SN15]EAT90251.1 hypothetical protein SNOG_02039 [Parastagonospora nodorum SN15]